MHRNHNRNKESYFLIPLFISEVWRAELARTLQIGDGQHRNGRGHNVVNSHNLPPKSLGANYGEEIGRCG